MRKQFTIRVRFQAAQPIQWRQMIYFIQISLCYLFGYQLYFSLSLSVCVFVSVSLVLCSFPISLYFSTLGALFVTPDVSRKCSTNTRIITENFNTANNLILFNWKQVISTLWANRIRIPCWSLFRANTYQNSFATLLSSIEQMKCVCAFVCCVLLLLLLLLLVFMVLLVSFWMGEYDSSHVSMTTNLHYKNDMMIWIHSLSKSVFLLLHHILYHPREFSGKNHIKFNVHRSISNCSVPHTHTHTKWQCF